MPLTKKETEVLRWFSAGHSVRNIEQYVDLERKDVNAILKKFDIENTADAYKILSEDQSDTDELTPRDDNLPNAGEEVPEFKPPVDPNANKLQDYDKRKIAERGGNFIDPIPMSHQQAFRMDIRWRPLAEIKNKWLSHVKHDEELLKAAVKEYSPSSYKRLYGED
jgi:hypothetical protein